MDRLKSFFYKQWLIIKKEFTSETPQALIINSLIVILGSFIYAFGSAFFIIPMNLITGGISSIALVVTKYVNLDIDMLILIITWIFFVMGLFTLGVKYSIRTLLFTITNPLFIMMFQQIIKSVTIGGVNVLDVTKVTEIVIGEFSIQQEGVRVLSYIASSLIGGSILGIGVGVALAGGGSSGGTDVINLLVRKYFHIKVGVTSFVQDIIIIIIGFFTFDMNFIASCFGIISALLCSILIDKVSFGNSQSYVALICTDKWYIINERIMNETTRGTTLVSIKGGYLKKDTNLIEVCFDKRDYASIKGIVLKIDPNAFITVMKASEIIGYGFTRKTPKVEDISSLDLSEKEKKYYLKRADKKRKSN